MAEQQRFVAEDFPGHHLPHGARDTLSGLRTWGWMSAASRDRQVAQLNANPTEAEQTSWKNDDNDGWMPDAESRARLRAATDMAAEPDPDFVADLDNRLSEEYRALYEAFRPSGPFPSTTFGSVSNDDRESPATRQAFADWLRRRPDRATPVQPTATQPAWQRLGFINEEAYNNLSTAAAEHADNAGHCGTYDRLAEEVGLLTREQTRHLQDRSWIVTARIATVVTVPRDAIDREKIIAARRALTRAVRDLTDDAVLLMISTD